MLAYDVRGDTVLLIVEIAKTSLDLDTGRKAEIYAKFGVRDYWVVNAETLDVRVHRMPGTDGYGDIKDLGPGDTIVPLLVPELALRLDDLGLT